MTDQPAFTLIIPAHNEEAVIARCLETVLADTPSDHAMQIIVAANGCRDRTVEIARAAAPDALVLDLAEGSKTKAMNAANAAARHFPRIYLDADIQISYGSLAALAEALQEPGVKTAAPGIKLDLSHANWMARAYYRVWLKQPYANAGKGGAGCYGISRIGFEEIGNFPDIIADDFWIHTRFPDDQRRFVKTNRSGAEVFTIVQPPGNAITQIRVEARRQIGNEEVRRLYPTPWMEKPVVKGLFTNGLSMGLSPLDIAGFALIKLAAQALARIRRLRQRSNVWSRDLTSRTSL